MGRLASTRIITLVSVIIVFAAATRAADLQRTAGPPQTAGPALSGTITAAGRPLVGVDVQIFAIATTEPLATGRSGQDGSYRVAVPRGVYRVVFLREGFASLTRTGIVVLPDTTNVLSVELRPVPAAADPAREERRTSDSSGIPALAPGEVAVRLVTTLGDIVIAVDTKRAPVTAANFLKYVDGGFYDGGRFHRATRPDNYTPSLPDWPMMEIIQAGINPARQREAFAPIALERTSVTGLKHVAGTVSMARGAPDSARSDFFILFDDQPSLDFGGRRFDDGQGAAAFGRVISGLDVARRIQQQPVKGQNLAPPVPIQRAVRY